MTSTQAVQLAERIIQNDLDAVDSLIRLLHAFRTSRGDPVTEAMADEVIGVLYVKTQHYQTAFEQFVSQESNSMTPSIAA